MDIWNCSLLKAQSPPQRIYDIEHIELVGTRLIVFFSTDQAWVTLATNDSYGLGALVLANSLRRVGSEHPTVVLITPSVTDAMR